MSQHKVRDAESATLSRRTVIGALGARNGYPGSERSDDGAARQRRGLGIADLVL